MGGAAPLACEGETLTAWRQVRGRLREHVPRFSTRLPFALYRSDVSFLQEMQLELERLGVTDEVLSAGTDALRPWSECTFGLLSLRILFILTQVSSLPSKTPRSAVELLPQIMAAPWVELLLSGWPVFTALAVLARWASPHANPQIVKVAGTHSRAASQAAGLLGASTCDQADVGAVAKARGLLGRLWRHPDPTAATAADTHGHSSAAFAEAALAGVEGAVWSGDAGSCRWTEHPGWYLGGLLDAPAVQGMGDGLLGAMAACDREPACAGVTAVREQEGSEPSFSLRAGDPLLEVSPVGEYSYARWCQGRQLQAAEELRLACPFSRVAGLLATATRRLCNGSLGDFAPELVQEAQGALEDWAALVGPENAGLEAWTTEWPLWELLGRLQQRLDLLQSPASGGRNPQEPWSAALQRAMGMSDEAWRLAIEEIASLVGTDGSAARVPATLREGVGCSTGKQCVGELYARLHLLLHGSDRLPLRDPIFMAPDDTLAPLYIERGNALVDGVDYDWGKMVAEGKERLEDGREAFESPAEALDRLMPNAHPLQVDRRQLANFVLRIRDVVAPRPLGRCLEWDQPFILVRAFQSVCRWFDVFSYSEPSPDEPRMGMPGRHEFPYGTRHYWGDLEHAEGLGIEPDTFDLILCAFVFEHVSRPFLAMKNLARVLRSGGYIIWAAPMFQQYHGSPHDYYRYTPNGARALAADAGLEVVSLYAPGDLALASGVMLGMMLPYWTERQALAEVPPEPGEDSPRHPLNVFALMRKPPLPGTRQAGAES